MKPKPFKYPYYWLALSMCVGLSANAQKLPNVQTAGLYAPATIKVDGKATEWGDQLQAFNKSTSVFYTMANNNDNLYLVIQAADKTIVDKILGGGITLTISSMDKKTDQVIITTPLFAASNRTAVTRKTNSKEPLIETDLAEVNKAISAGLKEITVKGITAIADPVISVYNVYGIKIAGQLDINKAYTCELAIPLKFINQLAGTSSVFNYNIKLNGANPAAANAQMNGRAIDPSSPEVRALLNQLAAVAVTSSGSVTGNAAAMAELTSPTDFSGTYTLIKK